MKILFILLFLVSCVKSKVEQELIIGQSPEDMIHVNKHCEEIVQLGNIFDLMEEIKSDTRTVFELLKRPDPDHFEEEISLLAENISQKADKVKTLSKEEWTLSRWHQEAEWQINRSDFKSVLGKYFKNGFSIINPKIYGIYFMGSLRDDLKDRFSIDHNDSQIIIKYKNFTSSLDICQLQKTLMVVMEVEFRNLNWVTRRYFNLYLNSRY